MPGAHLQGSAALWVTGRCEFLESPPSKGVWHARMTIERAAGAARVTCARGRAGGLGPAPPADNRRRPGKRKR